MCLHILGPFRVHGHDGAEVHIAGSRQRKILATLALSPNKVVSISKLVDVVWPDDPPATARAQVQNCLGALRRSLRDQTPGLDVLFSSGGYKLVVPDELLDLSRFNGLCRESAELAAVGHIEAAHQKLRLALDLWHGPALENMEPGPLDAALVRLEEQHISAVVGYIGLTERLGNIDHGYVGQLRAWATQHPFHEMIHASLAKALYQVGRTADALEVLRDFRWKVRDELGLDVSSTINQLELDILQAEQPHAARISEPPAIALSDLEQKLYVAMENLASVTQSLKMHRATGTQLSVR